MQISVTFLFSALSPIGVGASYNKKKKADLETVWKYVDYFFMPFFVKILYRSYGYARKFRLKWH